MGARSFETYEAEPDLIAAFRTAHQLAMQEQDRFDYIGSSATIARKNRVIVVHPDDQPLTREQAAELADRLLTADLDAPYNDHYDTVAGAIPVGAEGQREGWLFFGWAED